MLFIDSQQLRVSKPRTSPTKPSIFIGKMPRLTPRDLLWNSMFDLHRQTQSLSMKRSPFFMSEKTFFGWLYPLTQKSITCNGPWWFVNEIFRCDIFKEVYRRRMRRFQDDIHQSAWPPDVWKILVRTISNLYLEVCCFWLYWTYTKTPLQQTLKNSHHFTSKKLMRKNHHDFNKKDCRNHP